jgi:chemotaxis protein CheX
MTTAVDLPSAEDICVLVGDVWASFLGDEIIPLDTDAPTMANQPPEMHEVIASVSIAGAWSGHLVLGLARTGATAVAGAMFGSEEGDVSSEELADAVGELGNIIAGNIKSMLPEPSTLSLPQVVFDAQSFALPSARVRVSTVLGWNANSIIVSLWEAVPGEKGHS